MTPASDPTPAPPRRTLGWAGRVVLAVAALAFLAGIGLSVVVSGALVLATLHAPAPAAPAVPLPPPPAPLPAATITPAPAPAPAPLPVPRPSVQAPPPPPAEAAPAVRAEVQVRAADGRWRQWSSADRCWYTHADPEVLRRHVASRDGTAD